MEVVYSKNVIKAVQKRKLSMETWENFRDAFASMARTGNLRMFDVKKMLVKNEHHYYRLRIGKYRALFRMTQDSIVVEEIGSRGGVYRWL